MAPNFELIRFIISEKRNFAVDDKDDDDDDDDDDGGLRDDVFTFAPCTRCIIQPFGCKENKLLLLYNANNDMNSGDTVK